MDPHYDNHGPQGPGFPSGPAPHEHDPNIGGFSGIGGGTPLSPQTPEPSYRPVDSQEYEEPYFLRQDWEGNYKTPADKEKEGKEGQTSNQYGGPSYHFSSQDGMGLHLSLFEMAGATAGVMTDLVKYGIQHATTNKELSNYEDLYRNVLRKPENYSVFHFESNEMDVNTFSRIMNEQFGVKTDAFKTLDNTLLIKRSDREQFLRAAQMIGENPEKYLEALKEADKKKEEQNKEDRGEEHDSFGAREGKGSSSQNGDVSTDDVIEALTMGGFGAAAAEADNTSAFASTGKTGEEDAEHEGIGTYAKNQDALSGEDKDADIGESEDERGASNWGRRRGAGGDSKDNSRSDIASGGLDSSDGLTGGNAVNTPTEETSDVSGRSSRSDKDFGERKSVGTYSKNQSALSGNGNELANASGKSVRSASEMSSRGDAESWNNGLRNFARSTDRPSSSRKAVLSVSEMDIKGDDKFRDNGLRNFARSTDRLQVAAVSAVGTMINSAGKDDPALQQLRSGIRKVTLAKDIVNATPVVGGLLGARGEARAAELAMARNLDKFKNSDLMGFNALKNYAAQGKGRNMTDRLVNVAQKNGTIISRVGGKWDIDYKRLGNDVFGSKVTKEQIAALKLHLGQEERRRQAIKNHKQSVRNVTSNVVGTFSNQDDGTRAMRQMYRVVKTGFRGGIKAGRTLWKAPRELRNRNNQRRLAEAQAQANPYRQRFHERQMGVNARRGVGTDKNALLGGSKLKGGSNLTAAQKQAQESAKRMKAAKEGAKPRVGTQSKRQLRLRQDMETGGVSNAVGRNSLKLSKQGLKRVGAAAAGRLGATKLGKAAIKTKTGLAKAWDAAVSVTDPIRKIINLPAKIMRTVLKFALKGLLSYVLGSFLLIAIVNLLVSGILALAMFVSSLGETKPADSVAGTVYSELRYAEIVWASEIRSYGTNANKMLVSDLAYTDQELSLEDYLNSTAGIADYLGAFAVSNEEYKDDYLKEDGGIKDGVKIGLQGPQPFDGALLNDYKLITAIDGGNQLEIVGKPMDGWTSNAKEVVAMSVVFYQQLIDNINAESEYGNAIDKAWTWIKNCYKNLNEQFDNYSLGLLGDMAGASTSSWTGLMRNYAYPLFINSRYENYYLSSYIYPTYWSEENFEDGNTTSGGTAQYEEKSNAEARYDTDQETKEKNPGDEALVDHLGSGVQKTHAKVGTPKNGGSGKVNYENKVNAGYEASAAETYTTGFETCYDAVVNYDANYENGGLSTNADTRQKQAESAAYNGYGCQLRYAFSQKWLGSFGTDIEGTLTNVEGSGITKLHYGEADEWNELNEGDVEEELDPDNNNTVHEKDGQDVSADVSPYYEDADVERGYNENSCLVHPIKMSGRAWSCWKWDEEYETFYTDAPTRELKDYLFDYDAVNSALGLADLDSYEEGDWKLDRIEIDENSAENGKVYIWTYKVEFETWTDDEGHEHTREAEIEEMRKYTITHDCTGKHAGTYCGGHAQLRTRGIVMGFSEEQISDGNGTKTTDTSTTSTYDPKFLDPDAEDEGKGGKVGKLDSEKYGDAVDVRGDPIEVFDRNSSKYSNNSTNSGIKTGIAITGGATTGVIIGSTVGSFIAPGLGTYLGGLVGGFIGGTIGNLIGQVIEVGDEVAATGIDEEDQKYVKEARDIFDIDVLIKRPSDAYPKAPTTAGNNIISSLWNKITGGKVETIEGTSDWASWTITNMGQAVALALEDWTELYDVPDTQTIVGGQEGVNALDNDTEQNVLQQLGEDDIKMGLNLSDGIDVADRAKEQESVYPFETKSGTRIENIQDEVSYVNRLRHVRYAMSLVGYVSYSQEMHTYLWGNLSGHQTDCSGFVSNIWRDALGLTNSTGALSTAELLEIAQNNGAWESLSGTSIEESVKSGKIKPGDIILKDAADVEGSAHALLFVGLLDETEMYVDKDATVENQSHTYRTVGEGITKAYTIDCSTMTITTTTFQSTSPNKVLFSKTLKKDGYDTANKEPEISGGYYDTTTGEYVTGDRAPQKVRSGNVRFAARDYLQGTISGDIGYIDMDKLGKALGNYTVSGDTLQSEHNLMIWDFTNMQEFNEDQTPYPTKAHSDYATTTFSKFWDMTTSSFSNTEARKTVVIEGIQGEAEEEAKIEVEDPEIEEPGEIPEGAGGVSVDPNTPGAVKIGDKWYYWERQGADIWSGLQAASGKKAGGYACGFYALQSALSAMTGKVWTFQDVVELAFPGVKLDPKTGGYAAGSKQVTDWSMSTDRANKILAAVGSSVSSYNVGSTSNSKSKLDSELSAGKVVTVRTTNNWDPNGALHSTKGNGHWVTIVGTTVVDGKTKYICLGNQASGNHPILVDASSMPSKYESMITYNYSPSDYDQTDSSDNSTNESGD